MIDHLMYKTFLKILLALLSMNKNQQNLRNNLAVGYTFSWKKNS